MLRKSNRELRPQAMDDKSSPTGLAFVGARIARRMAEFRFPGEVEQVIIERAGRGRLLCPYRSAEQYGAEQNQPRNNWRDSRHRDLPQHGIQNVWAILLPGLRN